LFYSHFIKNIVTRILVNIIIYSIILFLFSLSRQSKKKKPAASENKVIEELQLDNTKLTIGTRPEDEVIDGTDVLEAKIDDTIEKELVEAEPDINSVKNENEIIADESLADVESLPESQPEQQAKSSKSSKRSNDRKSKSRSSRTSKYVTICVSNDTII